jgi:hypothetical protein
MTDHEDVTIKGKTMTLNVDVPPEIISKIISYTVNNELPHMSAFDVNQVVQLSDVILRPMAADNSRQLTIKRKPVALKTKFKAMKKVQIHPQQDDYESASE